MHSQDWQTRMRAIVSRALVSVHFRIVRNGGKCYPGLGGGGIDLIGILNTHGSIVGKQL